MRNKPQYSIASVDHALQLAALLQQEGTLRVTDAADRLGVSASTAHRLLSMLVYRDFAEQGPDRRYGPGKVLRPAAASEAPVPLLRRASGPHLRKLVDTTRETANLMVLAGIEVRFVTTVECDQVLRVGDRVGRSLPAHLSSGGKAMLAALTPAAVDALYADADLDLPRLHRELRLVRKRGFAINDQRTETGLTAVGVAVRDASGTPVAAVSSALPTARFAREKLSALVSAVSEAVGGIEIELVAG
ncbi:IclR family transcriptional regulator [Amycolatopsis sp. K13G38]|uniref:IclR family transcriptional regulator n=1 Tax=Amycolatopsis acididurans TaxID=2724524 RepID=A0ABX1IYV0_9PSEU|nr:IclR family transcriptional regulator [Amycolatopsis acididurans]NKQ52692.1 IclR family transcriptional regulator [Amycolatopsis acididurans]